MRAAWQQPAGMPAAQACLQAFGAAALLDCERSAGYPVSCPDQRDLDLCALGVSTPYQQAAAGHSCS